MLEPLMRGSPREDGGKEVSAVFGRLITFETGIRFHAGYPALPICGRMRRKNVLPFAGSMGIAI
jgi:hypothetical protein